MISENIYVYEAQIYIKIRLDKINPYLFYRHKKHLYYINN